MPGEFNNIVGTTGKEEYIYIIRVTGWGEINVFGGKGVFKLLLFIYIDCLILINVRWGCSVIVLNISLHPGYVMQ
jgi:hypothetical protein